MNVQYSLCWARAAMLDVRRRNGCWKGNCTLEAWKNGTLEICSIASVRRIGICWQLCIALYIYAMVTKTTYDQSRDIVAAGYGCKIGKRPNSIIIMHSHTRALPPSSASPRHALHTSVVFQRRARQAVSEAQRASTTTMVSWSAQIAKQDVVHTGWHIDHPSLRFW